ncbi:response regulator transcription factor [Clostridium cellulovorans]|uniref:Stage 0 sporulation protein A homolog n=1 Tax=Clostridium cellulovorans (strain ATCC 35296 / DSM 3052 / OCM 3 / 743B) TaxID=573061 RepID=D9SS30_CLOC7|nr:response regulator transcription factor [Clostridium cellulovorans]ADL52477.1 two component transcriptional regulator, winged helix family [Clostridium cellulovorans 743B]
MNKILVVEDDDRIRKLICNYLSKEGFEIIEAVDGVSAIEKFKNNNIDLIVLDLMLPKLNGITVCSKIREISDVHIIMLTAKSQEEDKLIGYETGADDYITKPFSPKVLVAKIKAVLKRIKEDEKEDGVLQFDDLIINELSREVILSGETLDLTPKEIDLILYLAKNKGIALSREHILEKVWGFDYEGDIRTVDTNVKRLRQKLKDKATVISTVRGSGYKFEA